MFTFSTSIILFLVLAHPLLMTKNRACMSVFWTYIILFIVLANPPFTDKSTAPVGLFCDFFQLTLLYVFLVVPSPFYRQNTAPVCLLFKLTWIHSSSFLHVITLVWFINNKYKALITLQHFNTVIRSHTVYTRASHVRLYLCGSRQYFC